MKKLLALCLILCLLLPVAALAEADAACEPLNFGDFNMVIDPEMAYTGMEERVDSQVWFALYPLYNVSGDSATSLNVVWNEESISLGDITGSNENAFIASLRDGIIPHFQAIGALVNDFSVDGLQLIQQDGKDALIYMITISMSYESQEFVIYQIQLIAPGDFGTYTFTGSARSADLLNDYIVPMLDSITWN